MGKNQRLKVHRQWLPGRSLCSIRSNRKWCKRRGSSLECQNCFFVYPIIDSNLKNLVIAFFIKKNSYDPCKNNSKYTCFTHKKHFVISNGYCSKNQLVKSIMSCMQKDSRPNTFCFYRYYSVNHSNRYARQVKRLSRHLKKYLYLAASHS